MTEGYETNFHRWAETQAGMLRTRSAYARDWDNLTKEIDGLAANDRREIHNRFVVLCARLLKWEFQPRQRSNSWRASIREARRQIGDLTRESPSPGILPGYPARRSLWTRARGCRS
jgi:hypothetical protein